MAKIVLDDYPNTPSECPFCSQHGLCKLDANELCMTEIKDEYYPLDPYVDKVDLNKCPFVTIIHLTPLFDY